MFSINIKAMFQDVIAREQAPYLVLDDIARRTQRVRSAPQSPRADLAIVPTDSYPEYLDNTSVLLIIEFWDKTTRRQHRTARRMEWANQGVHHYWEIQFDQSPDETLITVYDHHQEPPAIANSAGRLPLVVTEPFAISLTPEDIPDWIHNQAKQQGLLAIQAQRAKQS